MTPETLAGGLVELHHGDCIDVLATLPHASVDVVVTDPPYGLDFMGKAWDRYTPAQFAEWCERWAAECYRVLKPGGHLFAFGGSRTFHRLTCGVEDAGFEVRDVISWLYGSGFPKSLDVGQAVDKLDAAAERRARALEFTAWLRGTGMTAARIDKLTGTDMGGHFTTAASQPAVATADLFDKLRPHLPEVPGRIEQLVADRTVESANHKARPVVGQRTTGLGTGRGDVAYIADSDNRDVTTAHTDEAAAWEGWGTALKPAWEPIVVGRKPLAGTVAANVITHGTGAININACRTPLGDDKPPTGSGGPNTGASMAGGIMHGTGGNVTPAAGRWPTNVLLDGAAAAELDRDAGIRKSGKMRPTHTTAGRSVYGQNAAGGFTTMETYGDTGGASRFFPVFRYQAKAPTSERPKVDGVAHPTVKPLALMRWLVRLAVGGLGPDAVVLEPFAGSGTTVEAAVLEGVRCIAIEREATYLPLIRARLARGGDDPTPALFEVPA